MSTPQAMIIVFIVLLVGFFLFTLSMSFAQKVMKREVSFSLLLRNFNQKIWMTFCLGVLFFGLFLLSVYVISFFSDPSIRQNLFYWAYNNPIKAAYVGLSVFACVSISIYLARMAIISWYNNRSHH